MLKVNQVMAIILVITAIAYMVVIDQFVIQEFHLKLVTMDKWDVITICGPTILLLINAAILMFIPDHIERRDPPEGVYNHIQLWEEL